MENFGYEFDQTQNLLIRDLARKMRFVSYFLIALGLLLILDAIFAFRTGEIGGIITGIAQIFIGFWTNRAANAFQRIVETQGQDIENLLAALAELRKLYILQYWLILITVIFIIVAILLGFIWGTVRVVT